MDKLIKKFADYIIAQDPTAFDHTNAYGTTFVIPYSTVDEIIDASVTDNEREEILQKSKSLIESKIQGYTVNISHDESAYYVIINDMNLMNTMFN